MEIVRAKPKDSEEILNFLSSIFSKESVNSYCRNLGSKMADKSYCSILGTDGKEIVAHFGISFLKEEAIFNMMGVNVDYRNKGLAKELLNCAVEYSKERKNINYVAGYCVLQHHFSERIHDETFKPIGLMFTSENYLSNSDPLYPRRMFNGNLAVCKKIRDVQKIFTIHYACPHKNRIEKVLNNLGIDVVICGDKKPIRENKEHYIEVNLERGDIGSETILPGNDYVFLGMLPNVHTGFYNLGFVSRNAIEIRNKEFRVTYKDREEFINNILSEIGDKK